MALILISLLLFSLSSICDAIRDKISHHYDRSIFSNFNPKYWNPNISWKNKYIDGDPKKGFIFKGIFGFLNNFRDAWHTFKTIEIILLATSAIIQINNNFNLIANIPVNIEYNITLEFFLYMIMYGIAWNLPFNLFYNILLNKK